MAILRGTLPTDSFTIISNAWLRDPALSLKEKGLLAYIASHAAGHKLTTEQIIAESTDKADAVRSGLVGLEVAGYLRRIEIRDDKGHRTGTDFELLEPLPGKTQGGKIPTSSEQGEHAVSAGQPQTGFSQAGKSEGKKTTPQEKTNNTTSASPRGARLPEGWKPDAVLLSWYQVTILQGQPWSDASRAACRHEHEKFTDHWAAASGANARKLDWAAAWRNWMRRAFERRSATAPVSGAPVGPKLFETMKEERADDMLVRANVADQLREQEPSLSIGEALELAKQLIERHGINALSASASTGYIDAEVIDSIDGPREVSGS